MPGSTIRLLLVEDNPGDVRLAQEALREARIQNVMDVVGDGEQALAYLRGEGRYADISIPDMILLDMNLPRMDGFELLEEVKKDSHLADIPLVILAATNLDADMLKRYNVPTHCMVLKPLTVERFLEAVKCFPDLGITIVKIASAS
jgi:two-component system, chemotaxis family, response regulator Rcp1